MMKTAVAVFSLALVLAAHAPAQVPAGQKPEVLVLGVYHMANPGHDIWNMHADDVLAPRRQAELGALMEVLKKFRPTRIAVEADTWNRQVRKDYAGYLAGTHELTRNETEQIGFRLAKELGDTAIYPADADGDFPWQRVVNYAKATGRTREFDSISGGWGAMVQALDAYAASHTILETLLYLNADDRAAEDIGIYYRVARFGEPGDWAGADLVADWFRRNMRIYANIANLIDSPGERLLVIFGAGHLGWLRHAVESNPELRLRRLAEFAR